MLHPGEHVQIEPQTSQIVEVSGGTVEQTHDDALAKKRGQRRYAKIYFAADGLDLDAPVLRQPAFGDIELRHQLHAGDDGGFQIATRRLLIVEHAVDALADAKLLLERLDM